MGAGCRQPTQNPRHERETIIMAKKNTTNDQTTVAPVAGTIVPETTTVETNKAKSIRDYAAANPNQTKKEMVAGLKALGVDVTESRIYTVMRQSRNGSGGASVNVETIKRAAAFLKTYGGKADDAKDAINKVGGFVRECGSPEKAVAALDAYAAIAAAL